METRTATVRDRRERAESLLLRFTGAAMVTGAIPVPAASAAIVAENAAMLNALASAMGVRVGLGTVAQSLGAAGAINIVGRAVFVEAARALGWFAGPLAVAGISALGATTAGLQTWVLGRLTIAVCDNGGEELPPERARRVVAEARSSFRAHRDRAREAAGARRA